MVNKNLVLLSYGNESEYQRALFCILSFLAWCDNHVERTRIIIYTDQPTFFSPYLKDLDIEYFFLTSEVLKGMLGDTDYIHRRKIGVVDLTFQCFPNDDLIFIDSDTFFIGNAEDLLNGFTAGKSFMHKREYTFEEGLTLFNSFNQGDCPKAFIDYIADKNFIIGGVPEKFNKYDFCWNSGILGLTKDFIPYLPDVYKLTDEFYINSKWFISEQIAFSLILQRRAEISPTEKFVLHYWGKRQKLLIDKLITNLLNHKSATELRDVVFLRTLTQKWKNIIEIDLILEQAVIAFSQKHWKYGAKKSLQMMFRDDFNLNNYKELFFAIKSSLGRNAFYN